MALEDAKKAVSTVDLMLSLVGLLKSGFIVFAMVLLEYARKKQTLAENQAAVAKADVRAIKAKELVDDINSKKTSDDIIRDFLHK